MSKTDDIQLRMQNLISFVSDANDQVLAGNMVDLGGLDDQVASLCDEAISLPPEEARMIQPIMAEMISKLEELGKSLEDFQERMREQSKED